MISFLETKKNKLIMGKKKQEADDKKNEQEYTEMPPGWKEPAFTKEDNPQGRIYCNLKRLYSLAN
jgi:hypothetical protein